MNASDMVERSSFDAATMLVAASSRLGWPDGRYFTSLAGILLLQI